MGHWTGQEPEPTPCLSVAAAALGLPIETIYKACLDAYNTPKGRARGWDAVCKDCQVHAIKWAALHEGNAKKEKREEDEY
jgi:hypothetical protein